MTNHRTSRLYSKSGTCITAGASSVPGHGLVMVLLLFSMFASCADADRTDMAVGGCEEIIVDHIRPDMATGISAATVSDDAPLAHTRQFMPLDSRGQISADDAYSQAGQLLRKIRTALGAAGSDVDHLLKLNVYVIDNNTADEVRRFLSDEFDGRPGPAVSFVVSRLPDPAANVAMDAVAVACETEEGRQVFRAESSLAPSGQSDVAILPAGEKNYLSGQVAPGDLITATAGTMESLFATLSYYGYSADDIVQVKGFMPDVTRAPEVAEEVSGWFRNQPAPPFVAVEWTDESYLGYLSTGHEDATPIEIEVMVGRGAAPETDEAATHLGYPGLERFPTYSRAAEIHSGRIIHVSGLYGDTGKDAEGQVRDIFQQLEEIMTEAGSDMDHLIKATYYVTGPEPNRWIDEIRAEIFDPERAPASSKMPVDEVGMEGALITLDMIGVIP